MIQPHCIPHRFWKICSGTHVSCIKETERVVFQQMTGCVNSRSSQFKKKNSVNHRWQYIRWPWTIDYCSRL